MKATINNIEVEGTPQKIAELIREFQINYETNIYIDDPLPNGICIDKCGSGTFTIGQSSGGFFIK